VRRANQPAVITDARPHPDEELRGREIRYVVMMSIRAVALIAIVILAVTHAPWPWLWVPACLFGMLVIPWLAVVFANAGRRRSGYWIGAKLRARRPEQPTAALEAAEHPVIDADTDL
jgi:fatty acid desaturase